MAGEIRLLIQPVAAPFAVAVHYALVEAVDVGFRCRLPQSLSDSAVDVTIDVGFRCQLRC